MRALIRRRFRFAGRRELTVSNDHSFEPLDQPRGWLRLPVIAGERPHGHASQTHTANGACKLGSPISIGWSHKDGRVVALRTEGSEDTLLARLKLFGDSRRRQPCQICMRFRVIANVVSPISDFAHKFRISPSEAADQKKGCEGPMAFEESQKLWCACGIWPVIEGKRDLGSIRSAVQSGTEKLRGRSYGGPSCHSRTSSRHR